MLPYRSITSYLIPLNAQEKDSPLLGFQNFSMPCLMSTMRESSVNDSMTLKLQRGLTSKNVMPFFSAYARACSVGTCRLKARCSRLPTRIRGTPGACWGKTNRQESGLQKGDRRTREMRTREIHGPVRLSESQCHSWPVSFIYSIRPVISVPFSSSQRKEHSLGAERGSRKWIQIKPESSLKSYFFGSESSLELCSKKMRVKTK